MKSLMFPIVSLVIMIIFAVIFLVVTKKQEKKLSINNRTDSSNKSSSEKKSNAEVSKEDVFKFMEFDRIIDDMIVQDNGTKFTMAIKCKGINYDLMSEIEQLSVEEGFITFLNTLRFPIQLYVQAQNIDLKGAIAKYKDNISGIKAEYERLDYQYTKTVEAFDSTKDEIEKVEKERGEMLNVYEYAADIINYVERMSYNKNLLQRNFYVLLSYTTSEISAVDKFNKEEILGICYNELLTRCHNVISALASCSVEGKPLNSNELADLIYTAYNRDDKSVLSVQEAIESGFYRLYSTSEDAFIKKRKTLQNDIQNEAKIRALTALKDSIEKKEYVSPKIEILVNQEDVSRKASEMVSRENVPEEIKLDAQDRILKDYKVVKKHLMNQIEKEQNDILAEAEVLEQKNPHIKAKVDAKIAEEKVENVAIFPTEEGLNKNATEVKTVENVYTASVENNQNIQINEDKFIPSKAVQTRIKEEEEEEVMPLRNMHIETVEEPKTADKTDEVAFFDDRLGETSSDEEEDEIII